MLFSPSCDCCGAVTCDFFEDDFTRDDAEDPGANWDEIGASDVDISSNRLISETSNSLAIHPTGIPGTTLPLLVTSVVRATTQNDKIGIVVAYSDSSNYLYCLIEVDGGANNFELRQVLAGADTQLDAMDATVVYNQDYTLTMCYVPPTVNRDGIITAQLAAPDAFTVLTLRDRSTLTGRKAGVICKTITTEVRWDDFDYERHYDPSYLEDCRECGCVHGPWCEENIGPFEVEISVTDLTDCGDCTEGQCTALETDYIARCLSSGLTGTNPHYLWKYSNAPADPCDLVEIVVGFFKAGADYQIRVIVNYDFYFIKSYGASPPACWSFDDDITYSFRLYSGCSQCDWPNATIHLKSPPF